METFIAYNPTKLHFGKGVLNKFGESVGQYGRKALILTGKKSAKKYGYFEKVTEQLKKTGIDFVEYSGIKPNPVIKDVRKAIELAKSEQIEFIIALGGGSVVDSAKIVSLGIANDYDVWDIMKYKVEPQKALPVVVVLTFAGTGTEMNPAAVIQNHDTHEKIGYANPLIFPVESFLDPTVTLSIPKEQTIYGIVDLLAHSLEAFFAYGEAPLSDRFVAALWNEVIEVAPLLINDLRNLEYRERIMWAATIALNGTLYHGRATSGDWGVHAIGHVFSYLFDTPHGATLSLAYPAWLKFMKQFIPERIARLGNLITKELSTADETIDFVETFFKSLNSPVRLSDLGLCKTDIPLIKKYLIHTRATGMNFKLNDEAYEQILHFML